jgi:4-hydroxy-tetrahydrodipicolinate synthase
MTDWNGVFPAVTTKLLPDGSVDVEAMKASIERLVVNGVSGIIVLPMLGENASMEIAEREQVIRVAVGQVDGRVPVLSGLAETTLARAQAHARDYQSYGAQGLMVFPSLGYKTDPAETVAWYKGIAAASTLPIMIYNNPIAYGVDCNLDVLSELVDVPEIVCIKEETGDIRRVTDLYIGFGDRFGVFCGVDDLIVESRALGVTGWVSGMANVWPAECVRLFDLCGADDYAAARELYRILTPSFHLDTHVKLVQYIKLAESLVYGAPEWIRPPRLPLSGAERDMVIATVTAADAALKSFGRT